MEVYTPPALHRGTARSGRCSGTAPRRSSAGRGHLQRPPTRTRIATARLMRPSAVTHTTDVEQRSIELGLKKGKGEVSVSVPDDPTLVPPGWYMLFVTDTDGVPSEAKWVKAG